MREFLKRAKADYLLSSVLCIVLGIIFVVWKGGVIDVIGTILSVAMIIVGIIYLGSFISVSYTHLTMPTNSLV